MMTSTVKGDRAVQRCIEKYLAEISAALQEAGVSPSEIQNVVDDVRAQIAEVLASRTQGEPTLQDAQAVIAELDPPESYALETEGLKQKPPGPRQLSRYALWGGLISLLLLVLTTSIFTLTFSTSPEESFTWTKVVVLVNEPWFWVLLLCPLISGAVAISKIRRSDGRLYGLRLAFAEVLIGPLLLLAVLSRILGRYLCELFGFSERGWVPGLAFVIWCVLAWFLGEHVWRLIRRPATSKGLVKEGAEG